ncbi:hypothetical protein ACIPPQ_20215 [Sphingopyxis sp. LARHCG72]
MARAGRKRKEGRRDAKGKLRPIIMPDRGNDRTAAKREAFGTDGGDAIGRAYRSGLLGENGQRLMQTARSFHRAYWPMFGVGQIGCTLGDRSGGDGDGDIDREQWVVKTVQRVDAMGRDHRKAFDELVLDFWPDYGPHWLDALIAKQDCETSKAKLDLAIKVLNELAA